MMSKFDEFDVIVVMGAAVWPDGRLSGVATRRTHQAVQLFKRINAGFLVFSGGLGKYPPAEAEAMAAEAEKLGILPEKIIKESCSNNTLESVYNTAGILKKMNYDKCIVVSDSYHLRRCRLLFKSVGIEAYVYPITGTKEKTFILYWYWMHIREFLAILKYRLYDRIFGKRRQKYYN